MLRMLNEIQGKYVGQRYIKEEKRSNKEKESCDARSHDEKINGMNDTYLL